MPLRTLVLGFLLLSCLATPAEAQFSADSPAKYVLEKKVLPASALWRAVNWDPPESPGIKIALQSTIGEIVGLACFVDSDNEPVFNLHFRVLPYDLKSAYPIHHVDAHIEFPDGHALDTRLLLYIDEGKLISGRLTQEWSKRFRELLASNNGKFEVHWISATNLKQGFEDQERDAQKVVDAMKAQGPLVVEAPNHTHGPIVNLLGVYHQACLRDENGQPVLRPASGWLYSPNLITPAWMTPSLRYGGGGLEIDCIVMGDRKGGIVSVSLYPYEFTQDTKKLLTFGFPSGQRYSLTGEVDRDSWNMRAELNLTSVRTLVESLRRERGEMSISWAGKRWTVPLTANASDLNDYLTKCR